MSWVKKFYWSPICYRVVQIFLKLWPTSIYLCKHHLPSPQPASPTLSSLLPSAFFPLWLPGFMLVPRRVGKACAEQRPTSTQDSTMSSTTPGAALPSLSKMQFRRVSLASVNPREEATQRAGAMHLGGSDELMTDSGRWAVRQQIRAMSNPNVTLLLNLVIISPLMFS